MPEKFEKQKVCVLFLFPIRGQPNGMTPEKRHFSYINFFEIHYTHPLVTNLYIKFFKSSENNLSKCSQLHIQHVMFEHVIII